MAQRTPTRADGGPIRAAQRGESNTWFDHAPLAAGVREDAARACLHSARAWLDTAQRRLLEEQTLVVTLRPDGMPLGSFVLDQHHPARSILMLGRHPRCGLRVSGDVRVSMRHALFVARNRLVKVFDLRGPSGLQSVTGERTPRFGLSGSALFWVGRTIVFMVSGGRNGRASFTRMALDPDHVMHGFSLPTTQSAIDGSPETGGQLLVRGGDGKMVHEHRWNLDKAALANGAILGRDSRRCDYPADLDSWSRLHALACRESGELLFVDLASTNGLRRQDSQQRVSSIRLAPGQACWLGRAQVRWLAPG